MKNKCDCYHIQKKLRYTYHPLNGSPIAHDVDVGVCWGTQETDECNCGGDETKCDFYPHVREAAKKKSKESKDKIIRCKDCDVPHNKWTGCPKLNGLVTPPDFYCAFAEPKK